jgi:hypothetical protein
MLQHCLVKTRLLRAQRAAGVRVAWAYLCQGAARCREGFALKLQVVLLKLQALSTTQEQAETLAYSQQRVLLAECSAWVHVPPALFAGDKDCPR